MDTCNGKSPKIMLRNVLLDSCRLCMAQNSEMKCVFDTVKDNLGDKINFCTGLTLSKKDGLPSKICNKCVEDLTIAHRFKSACLLADETFRKVLESSIKTEDDYDDFNDVDTFDDSDVNDDLCNDNKVGIQAMLENLQSGGVKCEIKIEKDESAPKVTDRKKRGPYKKREGKPKRLKKYKFTKLTCISCNIKFKTKVEYEEHKASLHSEDTDTYVCEICGKLFPHRSSHYSHMKAHLPPQYSCSECDYSTAHKFDLVKHIRIHNGTKLYQCEICSRSYCTSSNLTSHIRASHQRQRPHHCTLCPKSFFDKTKLNRHLDSHNDIKRYQCDVCHSGFTRRCYWKKHLERQHSIVIPPRRPGRPKMNALISGEPPMSTTSQLVNEKPYVRPQRRLDT